MAKNNNTLIIVAALLIGGYFLYSGGYLNSLAAGIPQGTGQPLATGVTGISGYQPVLSTTTTDAKTGASIATAYDVEYAITNLSGQTRKVSLGTGSTGTNVNLNEKYVAWLKPNSSYYANKTEGTIQGATTALSIPIKRQNTVTTWVNNDPSNSTTRNSGSGVGTAVDALTAGASLNPTLNIQGVTLNRYFGDNGIDIVADFNGTQIKTITFGSINCHGSSVSPTSISAPQTHTQASGTTVYVGARYNCFVDSTETLSIPINVQAQSSYVSDGDCNASFKVYDDAYFTDSVTGAFVFGNSNDLGADTNSATNPSAQAYGLS